MTDHAAQRTIINAPADRCFAVALDFERYPRWAADIKEARILTTDDAGRGGDVLFRAAAMGRSTSYTLRYSYGSNPLRLSWRLLEGDVMRRMSGEYEFVPVDGDPESTEVTYHLAVDLLVRLPGFVKRRLEAKIVHTAVDELKTFIEVGVDHE